MAKGGSTIELGKKWWDADDRPGLTGKTVSLEIKRPRKSAMDTRWFEVKEVADRIGMSYDVLCRKIRSGEFYAQPREKGYMIPDWAVDEYHEDLRRKKRA